ncbi:hypothetical protein SLE2022_356170 [Rubroshorea leprosula]
MSWNPHMEAHYVNSSYPYNSAGSFMEYFEGLTYQHVNFIFDGASHLQESIHPSMATSYYKFGLSDSGSISYNDHGPVYEVNDCDPGIEEYRMPSTVSNEHNAAMSMQWEGNANPTGRPNHVDCPRRHDSSRENQVLWQDNIDPDNMSYEELLELGETVGTQNRGLSQELISLLPVSKFKCGLFSRKKSRNERCVICQMEYKRRDRLITLPCKHAYHVGCGTRWLGINKACPICYTEVFGDASKR